MVRECICLALTLREQLHEADRDVQSEGPHDLLAQQDWRCSALQAKTLESCSLNSVLTPLTKASRFKESEIETLLREGLE